MREYPPEYDYSECKCSSCDDFAVQKERAAQYLQTVFDELYSDKPLDSDNLDDALKDLACLLEVRLPKKDLTIQREIPHFLRDWINYNNQQLKKLA